MPATAPGSRARAETDTTAGTGVIRTPDQRLRVFVSSTLQELAAERRAVQGAISQLRLLPVMFELGARPHPARKLYRAYLAQSQVFVGVYWQSYGWVAPGQQLSGLEDEYVLAAGLPKLIYVKSPAPERDPRLAAMLARIMDDGDVSYQEFADELRHLVENDLAVLLSERFELTRPMADTTEPPLSGTLPAPATPLVDRQQDAAAVADLVLRRGVRLVTLTGPSGVGKSRLAIDVAARLGPEFSSGVRFIDLGPVESADLVPAAIAAGLGLITSGSKLITDLTEYLRTRRLLLLIDNFEQVSTAAPVLAELLAAAPGLTVLVTSRSVLRLSGEHEFAVSPLGVPPDDGADHDAVQLRQYAAVRLFAERARAAAPGFELTSDNAQAVAQICRRLDGLPLAIELAAARVRLLPPQALLDRLDGGLQVLTSGARDLPERQRTLRNTLDWSYGLLSPGEQALFARLGVFAGTFGLPAAQAVCGAADSAGAGQAVIDRLGTLVNSSLVCAEPRGDEPRFRLLATVREYALQRLRETGDWTQVHDRHAAHFLALAEPAEAELHGQGQLAWLDRLEVRHDNLAAALSWLTETGKPGEAVHTMWATWRFWWLHGHAGELVQFTKKTLACSQHMPPHERALALSGGGFVFLAGGDRTRAEELFGQSLPLFRQTGDVMGGALAAAALGHLLAGRHERGRARALLEQTRRQLDGVPRDDLTGAMRVQYLLVLALTENFLGQIQLGDGQHDRAAQHFASGLDAARSVPDRFTTLVSVYDLALSSQAKGRLGEAAALLKEGVALAADAGDKPSTAYYLEALAEVVSRQRHPLRATRLLAAASALLQAHGSGWLYAYVPRAPHDATVLAALRARGGDAAFGQSWARGQALTFSAAVRYALEKAAPGAVGRAAGSAGVLQAGGYAADGEQKKALQRFPFLGGFLRTQRGQRAELKIGEGVDIRVAQHDRAG
jgi:predicted ATPase